MPSHHKKSSAPGGSQRQLRVGEVVRHAVAEILSQGSVHDPDLEGHIITVPEVRMSPDLKLATVYVMPLGGRDTDKVIAALERNKKFLRGEIAHRVNLKFAPDIRFRVDERFDEAERIEKLLRTPAVQRDLAPDSHERKSEPMIVTTANGVIEPEIGDSDAPEKNISSDIARFAARRESAALRQAAAPEQPAAARQARRPWLGGARQADRHDLDPCGRGGEAAVPRPSAPAMPARSIRWPPAACRSRSAKPPRRFPS